VNFLDLSRERYSLRKYAPTLVEDEKLTQILEVGRLAPTAANRQPQRILVLKSKDAMEKARSVTRMMYNAPMALLVCYNSTVSWKNTVDTFGEDYDSGEVDAAIVTTAMMMEAADLGIGSLWVRGFDASRMAAAFDLPADIYPVAILLLGYPADEQVKPNSSHYSRKPIEELVTYL
jgi:nitroreductase